ncbi:MAG: hypothetical protein KC668_14935 [Myxococcales bacterium]|nr:hypothetical protein [Myxococcales bacterium]
MQRLSAVLGLMVVVVAAAGCGDDGPPGADAGVDMAQPDMAQPDMAMDAGVDVGASDAGDDAAQDAGASDAGTPSDTGTDGGQPTPLDMLTVVTTGTGTGHVALSAPVRDCEGVCVATYDAPSSVTLTATASTGADFVGWSGACAGTDPVCALSVSGAAVAVATFVQRTYDLDLLVDGAGFLTSDSAGLALSCNGTCRVRVPHGAEVALAAQPEIGSALSSWSGACAGADLAGACTLTMTGHVTAGATFGALHHHVVATRVGSGTGTLSLGGAGCSGDCATDVAYGTTLSVTATADAGSHFVGFGGDCSGTTCSLTVTADLDVTAEFARNTYVHTVTVTSVRGGAGRVVSAPVGIDCGSACEATFAHGEAIALTAEPEPGSTFLGWTDSGGDCNGTGSCAFVASSSRTLVARFEGHTVVRLNPDDRDADVRLREYDLLAADLDLDFGGVRSDVAVAPGSGVFYFEGHRTSDELGPYGVGVCSAQHPIEGSSVGTTDQAFGVTATGGIDHANMFQGLFDAEETEYYGMVVDYRGANPIVHAIVKDFDWNALEVRPYVARTLTMTQVTTPVYILAAGLRTVVGPEVEINPGNDTTNFPFAYDPDALLRAAGFSDTADALVMGWGSAYAGPVDDAPALSVSLAQSASNGATVTVTASATDAEDGDLTAAITWELLSSPYYEGRVTGSGGSFTFDAVGVGVHPARARVVDAAGQVTEAIVRVTVTDPLPTFATVQLAQDPLTGEGIVLDGSATQVRFTGNGKMAIRANQGCYGCFAYFEFSRLHDPENMGGGLVTGTGNLNPFGWDDVPESVAINVLGGSWRNLIPKASFPGPASGFDTYGVVVDYRAEHPTVYVIVDGVLHYEVYLDDVWTELYPMLYGNPLGTAPGSYDEGINFGASPFVYDPVTILGAHSIDTTGMTLGWGP